MDKIQINTLLLNISNGDNKSFEDLYVKTGKGIFSFLYTYLENYHDTEDAMQEVYIRIKRGIHTYKQGTNGSAWMLQIAKNVARTVLAKKKNVVELDSVREQSCELEYNSLTEIIKRILSEDERQIVILHVLWNYRHREIGKLLEMPTGTVTSKYKRAIEKLKKQIGEVK